MLERMWSWTRERDTHREVRERAVRLVVEHEGEHASGPAPIPWTGE